MDESECVDAEDPTIALETSTNFNAPVFVIGPTLVVPKPTLLTLTNSSFIFSRS